MYYCLYSPQIKRKYAQQMMVQTIDMIMQMISYLAMVSILSQPAHGLNGSSISSDSFSNKVSIERQSQYKTNIKAPNITKFTNSYVKFTEDREFLILITVKKKIRLVKIKRETFRPGMQGKLITCPSRQIFILRE